MMDWKRMIKVWRCQGRVYVQYEKHQKHKKYKNKNINYDACERYQKFT